MKVLVLEASTSSAKAMLYDSDQGVLGMESEAYTEQTGDARRHEMDSLFAQLIKVGARMAAGQEIAAIAMVGSWHTLVVTDEEMRPLFPSYTWASEMGNEAAREIRAEEALAGQLYRATGCVPNTTYPFYMLLQLEQQGLDVSACRVMDENAYLYYQFTGKLQTSRSAASGTSMLNTHTLDWDPMVLQMMGITAGHLPKLCDHLETAPLKSETARQLGLPSGIPVAVPEPDGAMNQVGVGALKPGVMTLSIGTSAAVRMIHATPYLSPQRANWCYYAPGTHIVGAATAGSTNCVDWFRKGIGRGMSFSDLESGVRLASDSPFFLPFLFGERCPGWKDQRSGSFSGLLSKHTVCDLYGAVLEGVIHNIFDCYERLISCCGKPETILLSGGILNSPLWSQMLANIFQREIEVTRVEQVSLLGGAAIALTAAGAIPKLCDFSPKTQRHTLQPESDSGELVRERFLRYRALYEKGD